MSIGSRIKELREDRNLLQKELAARIGVSTTTVSAWESDVRSPSGPQRRNLAAFFNIEEYELLISAKQPPVHVKDTVSEYGLSQVPVISWVYANRFNEIPQEMEADNYVWAKCSGSRCFALRVFDNCMEPLFYDGDIIVIDPDQQPDHNSYVVVMDRAADTATFKQFKRYDNKVILHPLNPKYDDIVLDSDPRYRIIGKVIQKVRLF